MYSYVHSLAHVRLFMNYNVVQISEDDFQNVLDRVATSKDFATVRDNILFFLQVKG